MGVEVPDWRHYTVGEHTPKLLELQKKLAAKGLKDPWIRNEVWRYDLRQYQTPQRRVFGFMTRGFFPGLAAALVFTAYHYYYKEDGHH